MEDVNKSVYNRALKDGQSQQLRQTVSLNISSCQCTLQVLKIVGHQERYFTQAKKQVKNRGHGQNEDPVEEKISKVSIN